PSAIAAKFAIGGDHAMAGHDNRDGIGMVGLAYGTKPSGRAYLPGDLGIGAGFSIWNFEQRLPATLLEFGPAQIERERKVFSATGKVFLEFTYVRSSLLG